MANFTVFPVNSSTIPYTTPENLLSEINISAFIRDLGIKNCVREFSKVATTLKGRAIVYGYDIVFSNVTLLNNTPYYLVITLSNNLLNTITIDHTEPQSAPEYWVQLGSIDASGNITTNISNPINASDVTYNLTSGSTTVQSRLNNIGDPDNLAKLDRDNNFTGETNTFNNIVAQGTISANMVYNAVYNDYAELIKKETNTITTQGDIIAKVPGKDTYMLANQNNKKLIVGVHSETYGSLLGGDEGKTLQQNLKTHIPIAVCGFVPIKVIGKIKEGDFITISNIPGVGTKARWARKNIVGKALETNYNEGIKLVKAQVFNH